MFYAAQAVGFAAVAVSFFIYLQKSRQRILFCKLITDILWVLHHMMIFSYTAALTTACAIVRELVFSAEHKLKAHNKVWLYVFAALFAFSAYITWKDAYSVIPAAYSIVTTFALWHKKIAVTRSCIFCGSLCMLFYGLHYGSIATVINEILTMISIVIAIIIEYTYKQKTKQKG